MFFPFPFPTTINLYLHPYKYLIMVWKLYNKQQKITIWNSYFLWKKSVLWINLISQFVRQFVIISFRHQTCSRSTACYVPYYKWNKNIYEYIEIHSHTFNNCSKESSYCTCIIHSQMTLEHKMLYDIAHKIRSCQIWFRLLPNQHYTAHRAHSELNKQTNKQKQQQ